MVRKLWVIVIVIAAALVAAVVIAVRVPDPGLSPALAQRQPDVRTANISPRWAIAPPATPSPAARRWPAGCR